MVLREWQALHTMGHQDDLKGWGVRLRKWHIGLLMFSILLVCLLFILHYLSKEDDVVYRPPAGPVEPPPSLPEQPVQEEIEEQEPEQAYEEPAAVYIEPESYAEEQPDPKIQELIRDLKDDDIPYNAWHAMNELSSRLPDDSGAVNALIGALNSGDQQQRQAAAYLLAPWASQLDLSSDRRFLQVMVEALRDDDLSSNCKRAASFLLRNNSDAVEFLQSALRRKRIIRTIQQRSSRIMLATYRRAKIFGT